MSDLVDFAQTLNSKLCHEFAGTIGAINNCVELISIENEDIKNSAIELLKENTTKLVNKLKLYRYTYGISNDSDMIRKAEIIELSNKFLESDNRKIKFDHIFTKSHNISLDIAKMIFSLIIEAYNNFIKDGSITLTLIEDKNNHHKIQLKVTSKWLKIDMDKSNILSGRNLENTLNIHNVNEYYLCYLTQKLYYKLSIDNNSLGDNIIEYTLEKNLI